MRPRMSVALQTKLGQAGLSRILADFKSGRIPIDIPVDDVLLPQPDTPLLEYKNHSFTPLELEKSSHNESMVGGVFRSCRFRWLTLKNQFLKSSTITSSDMIGTRVNHSAFEWAYMRSVDARWSTWRDSTAACGTVVGCDFSGSRVDECDFSGCDLAGTKFVGARLTGVDFSNADLSRCDFTGCDLTRTRFSGANFHNTIFAFCLMDLNPNDLPPVNVAQANFWKVTLKDGTKPLEWPKEPLDRQDEEVKRDVEAVRFYARHRLMLRLALTLGKL